ncbi:hypothetical protein F383_04244 [Gossypium arboreum]|uniref:Uncharacterized protein n=1 Tax=Gossypium arboreum TaxID=29729 RepID=A0A0B0P9K2_GOSAR|nr:hypothetical protein F383_04244 [Gossypium arboreum]
MFTGLLCNTPNLARTL